jgi:hypothetical protein
VSRPSGSSSSSSAALVSSRTYSMALRVIATATLASCACASAVENGWGWPSPEAQQAHEGETQSDPAARTPGSWVARTDTSCPHAAGSLHVLSDPQRLLVAGGTAQLSGKSVMNQCTETLEDPLGASGTWKEGTPLLLPRSAHAGAVVNSTAFVFGGLIAKDPGAPPSKSPPQTSTAEMLGEGGWLPAPPLPAPRTGARAASLPDGRALIVGGFSGAPPSWQYLNTTLFFDGSHYTPGPELPCRAGPSPMCGLSNMGVQECAGSVFAVGGSGLNPAFPIVWRLPLAPRAAAWLPAPNLSAPLTWTATACVRAPSGGGTLYVIGGFGGTFQPTSAVVKLELASGGVPSPSGWTQATPLPGIRAQIEGAAVNESVFAIGGLGLGITGTAVDVLSAAR